MDVSDIKLLQSIYYILQASVSIRSNLSLPDFRIFLISELRTFQGNIMTQVTYIKTSVWLNLRNGKEKQIFCNTEDLDLPECYDFLEDLKITTSTDICAFICAWDPEEPNDFSEFDSRILPLFFSFIV